MASTGEVWKLGHRPALDGVRGIAVLLVVAGHAAVLPNGGSVGVLMFFTLSGFLITSVLLAEHSRSGRLSLRSFYRRRALRLFPALGVFAAFITAMGVAVSPIFAKPGHLLLVLGYAGNWYEVVHGNGTMGGLSHTWSLAVEEQFYVLWPVVLIFAARRGVRVVMWVAIAGAAVSVLVRWWLWDPAWPYRVEFGFDTRADALLIGCALAAWMHGRQAAPCRPWVPVAALVGVGVVLVPGLLDRLALMVVTPLLTAALLWSLTVENRDRGGVLSWRPLVAIGKRSYSWYLWHMPLVWLVSGRLPLPLEVGIPLMIALSWVLACASYRFVELPFVELKDRSGGAASRDSRPLPPVPRGQAAAKMSATF